MSAVIEDTRALLRLFRQSGYGDFHLRSGDYELFVAKPGGSANPLRALAAQAPPPTPAEPVVPATSEQLLSAPHIATFVSALDVGSAVAAGDAVARIDLLGEPIDLLADHAGMVTEVLVRPGALVEYAAPLVRLLAA